MKEVYYSIIFYNDLANKKLDKSHTFARGLLI